MITPVVRWWYLLATSLLLASSPFAQDRPDTASVLRLDDIVVTATRADLSLADVPGPVTVLTREQVLQIPAVTTDDVLRGVPSFSLFRRSSSDVAHPTTQGVNVRGIGGSGASRTLVLLDGMPLNDPFGGWVHWSRFRPGSLERLEILRGGGAHLWGNYALGGVIQLVTAPPDGVEASFLGGNGETRAVDLTAGTRRRAGSVGVEVGYFETGGYPVVRADQRGTIDVAAKSRSTRVRLIARRSRGTGREVYFQSGFFWEDRGNGTGLTDNETLGGFASASYSAPTDNGVWKARTFLQLQRFESRFSSQAADRATENPALDQFRVPSWATGFSLETVTAVGGADGRQLLTAGIDARAHSGETNERYRYVDGRFIRQREAGGNQLLVGAYLQDIITLAPRVDLTVGTRTDLWRSTSGSRREQDLTDGSTIRSDQYSDRTESVLSPKAALTIDLTGHTRSWFSFYRSFRGPTVNELYRPFRVRNDITEANQTLDLERLSGGDAGFRYANPRGSVSASLFWNRVSDLVLNLAIGPGPGVVAPCGFVPPGGSCNQRHNIDRARIRGLEVEASLSPEAPVGLTGSYAFTQGRITEFAADRTIEGNRLPQVPDHRLSLAIYGGRERLRAQLRYRWTGDQFEDQNNARKLESFGLFDASLTYLASRQVTFSLQAENLLDEDYTVGITNSGLVTVGKPRRIYLSVRLSKESGRE